MLLGIGIATLFVVKPARTKTERLRVPWYDGLAAVAGLVVCAWVCLGWIRTDLREPPFPPRGRDRRQRRDHRPGGGGAQADRGQGPVLVHDLLHRLRAGRPSRPRRLPGPLRRCRSDVHLPRPRFERAARHTAHRVDDHRHRLHLFRRAARHLRRVALLHRHLDRADGPLPGRLGQDRGDRVLAVRLDLGFGGFQRRLHRGDHHPADAQGRLSGARRRRDRGGGLDRRPADAADDGRGGLRDGGVPADRLPRRGAGGADPGDPLLRRAVHPGRSVRRARRHHPGRREPDPVTAEGPARGLALHRPLRGGHPLPVPLQPAPARLGAVGGGQPDPDRPPARLPGRADELARRRRGARPGPARSWCRSS